MDLLPAIVVIGLTIIRVDSLTYPTVVEAELDKSYVMNFTFDPSTSNKMRFFIYNVTSAQPVVSIVQNTTTIYPGWRTRADVLNDTVLGTVTLTLNSVLVTDEGWYRVTIDTGQSEQSGRFPIVTYAQPISLTITQTITQNTNERHIRCTGNVGRPHPVLRLLQSPPYNDVTNHEIRRFRPTSPLQNGTFLIDHVFNVTFPFSDNGTHVVCDVIHDVALGKQLRPIKSNLELILVDQPVVSSQSITISGTTTLVTPTSELKITCQPSPAGIDDINIISIQKNSSIADYATLVSVAYSKTSGSSEISWTNTVLQNRQGVSATGNVDSKDGARLELTITKNNTKCEDGGAYRCNMGVTLTGGSGGIADDERYVTATVEPTYTNTMTVSPTPNVDGIYYSVGTMLTFNCYGTVGSNKREHTWCYKRSTDATFTGYPDNAQNPSINQNNDGLTASGCNFIRSSTLTYNVTSADTSTTFMCEPYTGSFCGGSAANLKTELTIKNYVSNTNTGGQGDSDSTSSAGTIAGAVIGAFAGILLIVLIVYFVVFRRRSSGETYNTKEDGSPESAENGGPAHTEGPVYSVPDKNRSRGASPPGQPPSPPRESESLVEAKRELHYADLDIASRPPGVPAPRLSKHTPTEYATVKFV